MKFTQEQLESMSDFELNLIVCEKFIPVIVEDNQSEDCSSVMVNDIVNMYPLDFCNNWSDCGDLIEECNIGLDPTDFGGEVEWFAKPEFSNEVLTMDKNPKRAVTIVYILVKQCNE